MPNWGISGWKNAIMERIAAVAIPLALLLSQMRLARYVAVVAILAILGTVLALGGRAQAEPPANSPMPPVTLKPGYVSTLNVEKSAKFIVIGDPKIVDVVPTSENTFILKGLVNGATNVLFLDERNEIMATVDVFVGIPPTARKQDDIKSRAQEADDGPRLGETRLEYEARIARTRGDREALREALREKEEKAHRDGLDESQQRNEAASKRYERAVKDFDQTIKDQKARDESARQAECNRLSQRAAYDWSPSAARRYDPYCAH